MCSVDLGTATPFSELGNSMNMATGVKLAIYTKGDSVTMWFMTEIMHLLSAVMTDVSTLKSACYQSKDSTVCVKNLSCLSMITQHFS